METNLLHNGLFMIANGSHQSHDQEWLIFFCEKMSLKGRVKLDRPGRRYFMIFQFFDWKSGEKSLYLVQKMETRKTIS